MTFNTKVTESEKKIWLLVSIIAPILVLWSYWQKDFKGDAAGYEFTAAKFAETGKLYQQSDPYIFDISELKTPTTPGFEPLHQSAPGYGFFLGVFYKIFGVSEASKFWILLISSVLLSLTTFITTTLWMSLFSIEKRPIIYRLGLFMICFWPSKMAVQLNYYAETLTTILLVLWFYAASVIFEKPLNTRARYLLALLSALVYLTRVELVVLIFFSVFLIIVFDYINCKKVLGTSLFHGMVVLACMLLMGLNNYKNYGRFSISSSASGRALWMATTCSDTFYFGTKNRAVMIQNYVPNSPFKTNDNFAVTAIDLIEKDPLKYLSCFPSKVERMLLVGFAEPSWDMASSFERLFKIFSRIFKVTIIFGALFGLIFFLKHRPFFGLLAAFGVFSKIFLIHILIWGNPRYVVPFEPLFIWLTCYLIFAFPPPRHKWFFSKAKYNRTS